MNKRFENNNKFETILHMILENALRDRFEGIDPYDGLNTDLFEPLLKHSRAARLFVIQMVKRSPFNLRSLLRIRSEKNPKGLALFLSGLSDYPLLDESGAIRKQLIDSLIGMASAPDGSALFSQDREAVEVMLYDPGDGSKLLDRPAGWGYNFPWQSRKFLNPPFFPTVVCTSFVVDAFLRSGSHLAPDVALAAANFVDQHLNRHTDDTGVCFSYSPSDHTRVYNASLFGAKILTEGSEFNHEEAERWRGLAKHAVNYVVSRQNSDGSWQYGEAEHWKWIDNLHTGFILETVGAVSRTLGTDEWDEYLIKGLNYYRSNLFESDGTAKYYSEKKYPLDPHSFAQGALTFLKLSRYVPDSERMARSILEKAVELLWDEKREGFIFRRNRFFANRTIYLRWSQAWMFRALSLFARQTYQD